MCRVEGEPVSYFKVLTLSMRHMLTGLICRTDANGTPQHTRFGNSAESSAAHIYEIQYSPLDEYDAARRHHGGYSELSK
jgi:hypothetical protein